MRTHFFHDTVLQVSRDIAAGRRNGNLNGGSARCQKRQEKRLGQQHGIPHCRKTRYGSSLQVLYLVNWQGSEADPADRSDIIYASTAGQGRMSPC